MEEELQMAQPAVAWGRAMTKVAAAAVRHSANNIVAEVAVKMAAAAARCWDGAGVAAPCLALAGKYCVGKCSGRQQSMRATKQPSTMTKAHALLQGHQATKKRRRVYYKDAMYGNDGGRANATARGTQ